MSSTLALILGLAAGLVTMAFLTAAMLRKKMIVAHQSSKSFETTCDAIDRVVPQEQGWGFPIPTWDMMATFEQKGQIPTSVQRIKIFFVCNASLAKNVLSADPVMAGLMPCSWAVYERTDGSVWISKMNIPLMSKLFSGTIGQTMGKVGAADKLFLDRVLSPSVDD